MIALAKKSRSKIQAQPPAPSFEQLLPGIRKQAGIAFREVPGSEREELIAEVVANCFVAYRRLIQRGLGHVIYASPLALYAIKQIHAGRRVGTKLNVRDVSSPYCQQRKGVRVERLDRYDVEEGGWKELVVEDRRATPADVAATRIDFAAWLRSLSHKQRRIAKTLATGEMTSAVARKFRLSAARVSQLRHELRDTWLASQDEVAVT